MAAVAMRGRDLRRLLAARKLSIVLDLDHTLVHAVRCAPDAARRAVAAFEGGADARVDGPLGAGAGEMALIEDVGVAYVSACALAARRRWRRRVVVWTLYRVIVLWLVFACLRDRGQS
jgi:hypothetical protein